jgi:hypothetical protein
MPSPDRALVLSRVSEAEFQRWLIDLARRNGWRIHAYHDSRTQDWGADSGWPDLFLARDERAVAAELKDARGRVRGSQKLWQAVLGGVPGIEVYVWRPGDEQQIREVLA